MKPEKYLHQPNETLKNIRRVALNLLTRREHSEAELRRKLQLKGFVATDIQIIISQLVQENLLSNLRFVENYIHFRRAKGFGPLRICAELTERGISKELIEHHLQITDNEWLIKARMAWQKRFRSLPNDFKSRARQMRFLQSRGFTADQIEEVFAGLSMQVCHASPCLNMQG